MAKPRKVTEIVMSIRVAQKSPLERLLVQKAAQGVSRTVAVHQMAELLERALNEDWGPPPGRKDHREDFAHDAGIEPFKDMKLDGNVWVPEGMKFQPAVDWTFDPGAEPVSVAQAVASRTFQVSDDGLTHREVSESEALALAREQYPAGLVPVVDDGDDERAPDEVELQDDLSHLV